MWLVVVYMVSEDLRIFDVSLREAEAWLLHSETVLRVGNARRCYEFEIQALIHRASRMSPPSSDTTSGPKISLTTTLGATSFTSTRPVSIKT